MNIDDMRSALANFRTAADERAAEIKNSQEALDELIRLYQCLDDSERSLAKEVISEWVGSDDEGLRFDALALIGHYAIDSAAEPLEQLAERLRTMGTPGAPYELIKADRLLERFRDTKAIVPSAQQTVSAGPGHVERK